MPFVWALVLMVASYAIQAIAARRQPQPSAATLNDFVFPQAADGTPIPVVFGDVWVSGDMVIWYGNLRNVAIHAKGK